MWNASSRHLTRYLLLYLERGASQPAVGRGRPDGRRATKDELATLQVPLPLSLAASQQLLVCRIRDSEPVPSIAAVSVSRPAQPTDNRSCSLSFQIIPRFSARIDSQVSSRPGPSGSLLAFLIAPSIFSRMTESKYDSRVILTFVLRIPKVKLGAGGRASGWRAAPVPAAASNRARRIRILIRARPPLRLPAALRDKKTYTCVVCFPVGLCATKSVKN